MVSSAQVLEDLNNINTTFKSYQDEVNNTKTVWEGVSCDNLNTCANEFVGEFKGPINTQMTKFASALDYNEKYEKIKDKCELVQSSYEIAVSSDDTELASQYRKELSALQQEKEKLKILIESLLSSVAGVKIDIVESTILETYSTSTAISTNTDELLLAMGGLRKLGEKETLASFYEEGYIQEVLADIQKNYSGRDIAVQSALALIKLAADKGVKLDYDFGGAHDGTEVTTNDVLKGVDCSSFASFIINQASTKSYPNMTTGTLKNNFSQYKVNYEDAKPGDLLNYHRGDNGHVEIIIENHPEEGYFITAEAKSTPDGIVLSKTSYSSCRSSGQDVYNMDEVYDR